MLIRKWVIEQLQSVLPKSWLLIPYDTNLNALSQPVVMLKLQSITRTPAAPNSGHTVGFVLTIIEPKQDPAKREDPLDENLIELIYAIDKIPNLSWSNAERVMFQDNLAFDIALEVVTSKDKETA